MKKISIIFIIFLVLGCGSGSNNINSVSIPNWFINAPQNSSRFIYGAGSGYDLKEAKASALNDMASRLIVTVSSTINTNKKTTSGSYGSSYERDVEQNIKLEVKSMKFQNAKVFKNSVVANKYYIIMRADRYEIFNNKKREFDILDKDIIKRYKNTTSSKELEKIALLQDIAPKIDKAKSLSYVLNALNSKFDTTLFENRYNDYMLGIQKAKNSLVIKVESNSDIYKKELLSFLNENGYKTSTKANSNIIINNTNQFSQFKGWHISKSTTSIDVSSFGKSISNNVIKSIGRSSTSKESAYIDSSRKFAKKIRKLGINKILFGK